MIREPGLRKSALLWLCLLAPFFFGSYGLATWVTSQRSDVSSLVFDWERHMPFWAWTILPYWSIDVLYGLSLLLPRTHEALKCHALRLLTAQVIAVSCFLLWPLQFSFAKPETDGMFGWLFAALAGFDKPFNQAPSLHIALLIVLWVCYAQHTGGFWRWLVHGWFALIGLSVLTTYQHHFIDVPTGALVGWLCIWLWPQQRPGMLSGVRLTVSPRRRQLAGRYALLGLSIAALALGVGGPGWWLFWPALSVMLVALNYVLFDATGFQKGANGQLSMASRWLFAPYLAAAWLNSRWWTRKHPHPCLIVDNVCLGRIPTAGELKNGRFLAVLDLCAELPLDGSAIAYHSQPVLDLTVANVEQCREAAVTVEHLREHGPLLVCCALGYSRGAMAVAAWLLHTGRATSVDAAIQQIQKARPRIVLHDEHRKLLTSLVSKAGPANGD
ncbi:phosphatase PAP2/dual specificity phosphatase family protein [Pseudomonas sp. NPDC088444]|uniref:phosphatase PAP2/dual specificity phosphatase family protein n=1 Tax=Pseudomonas sp. NPDC088444 TaxID=3364456 RepID=UPI00384E35CC